MVPYKEKDIVEAFSENCTLIPKIAKLRLYMSDIRNGQLRQAARQLHALAFILPSVILGVLINIPKFFETEHVLVDVTDQGY